jgi:hypothetical protein
LVGLAVIVLTAVGLASGSGASAATAAPSAGRWVRVDAAAQDFPPGSAVTSVVEFRGQLVAAGTVPATEHRLFPSTGALWTSADGRRWQRVLQAPFGDAFSVRLASTRSAIYAIAAGHEGDSPEPSRVWRSTDEQTWQLLTARAPSGLGEVVAGSSGLVAVGSELAPACDSGIDCLRTAIWSSPDGATWTRVPGDASTFPAGFVTGVVRTRDGYVAVGNERKGMLDSVTRVWTSRRGEQWNSAPSPALTRVRADPSALAANDRTALLVGIVPSRAPAAPTTTTTNAPQVASDGSTTVTLCATINGVPAVWTRSGTTDWRRASVTGMDSGVATIVVSSHGNWVGAAVAGDCSSSRPVLLTSSDGRRWSARVAEPAAGATVSAHRDVSALAPTPSGAIAFVGGFADPAASPDVWLWTAPK